MSDNKKDKIYAECINEGVQVAGLKLAQPTNVSVTNLDEAVMIKYTDPDDILLNGSPIAQYDGTAIVRKVGSPPTSKIDGLVVSDTKTKNRYKTDGFIDTNLVNGTEYYYGIFPYTDDGVYNFKYSISITPQIIYPNKPVSSKVVKGNSKLKVYFELPLNATKAKICYSTTDPELQDDHTTYGNSIEATESPITISDLENDIPYYVTVYSCNDKDRCTAGNTETATPKIELYGMIINNKESNPNSKITYIEDNVEFEPAYMDYGKNQFNYGDWANAFFMDVKPCMLKYNGTVDYYLNPNDYSKKLDSNEDSDIENEEYPGNVMVEFPKIYWKVVDNQDDTGTVYISDTKVDEDYHCWSNIDCNGKEIDHFYISAYEYFVIDNKIRSLSNKSTYHRGPTTEKLEYCKANNLDDNVIWDGWVYCDIQLLRLLLTLLCKSTNGQEKFGYGNDNSYVSESSRGIKDTGTLNNKGLFWGDQSRKVGVKVFGIEHFWGNQWKTVSGWVLDHTIQKQKVKLTYGRSDGSEVDGYNITGEGYITIDESFNFNVNNVYITGVKFTPYGLIPNKCSGGSATTYYCDAMWNNNSRNCILIISGSSYFGLSAGIFITCLTYEGTETDGYLSTALSCKPLASSTDE